MRCPKRPKPTKKRFESADGQLLEAEFVVYEKTVKHAKLKSEDPQNQTKKFKPSMCSTLGY